MTDCCAVKTPIHFMPYTEDHPTRTQSDKNNSTLVHHVTVQQN